MKKNLFEMGASFGDEWSSDNKQVDKPKEKFEIKEPSKHQLHFAKEKRRGKTVTIVKPFFVDKKELQTLLKQLKKTLGVGGTLKDNTLEFQGEVTTKLKVELINLEFRFKS